MNTKQVFNLLGVGVGYSTFYFPVLTPLWGVLFLVWVWDGFVAGETMFLFKATKKEAPWVFWLTQILWFLFALVFILRPFFPEYLS